MKLEYSDEYGRKFGDLAERQLSKRVFPNDFIEEWSGLIETVEGGYCYSHIDLDYDLESIREPIDTFLVDDVLNTYPEHETFINIIQQLDQQYLALTQELPQWKSKGKWWESRILKSACKEYADFLRVYVQEAGMMIEVMD